MTKNIENFIIASILPINLIGLALDFSLITFSALYLLKKIGQNISVGDLTRHKFSKS
jgi:hypothetical protein